MQIAITADLHLTTRENHPERYHALENILQQMLDAGMEKLIMAGDVFDETAKNYADFDSLFSQPPYRSFEIFLIPGNHDARLSNAFITAANVEVITEPVIKQFSSGVKFLFLPYNKDKTMGEEIAANVSELPPNQWILVGHGDWSEGLRETNPAEPGIYMPLTRSDIETYQPAKVILGHIHKPMDGGRVFYVGSPCATTIAETGYRRFLILDAEGDLTPQQVETDVIYFNETFVVLPVKNEEAYIRKQISQRIKSWSLLEKDVPKVRVRIRVLGYTADKRALMRVLKDAFNRFRFYENGEPDMTKVSVADDVNKAEIATRVSDWIERVHLNGNDDKPGKDEILLEALHVIYGD